MVYIDTLDKSTFIKCKESMHLYADSKRWEQLWIKNLQGEKKSAENDSTLITEKRRKIEQSRKW